MGIAEAISAILSGSATVLCAMGSLVWWAYRRGLATGAEKARHQADQRAQARAGREYPGSRETSGGNARRTRGTATQAPALTCRIAG